MPKHAINYANTIIYKLVNYNCPENVYVGSTTNWTKRKYMHKYSSENTKYIQKVYNVIREHGGWAAWNMIEIKKYPCANKREAEMEEDKIMRHIKANMNSCVPYLTEKDLKKIP